MSSAKYTKEQTKETKQTKEQHKTTDLKPNVVVEKVQNEPIIVEHHHHHTHTVVHPEVVREHDTTEIRQVVQPVYEHVKSAEKVEYAGKDVKVVEKAENVSEAQKKLEAHHRDIQAKADITHTKDESTAVDKTKERDVHAGHKVIEEVTPVIIRDVDHNKTIHKDEKIVEKIHHAPEVIKEEKKVIHKEGYSKDTTHGLKHKEGYTKETTGVKETKDTTGITHGRDTKTKKNIE